MTNTSGALPRTGDTPQNEPMVWLSYRPARRQIAISLNRPALETLGNPSTLRFIVNDTGLHIESGGFGGIAYRPINSKWSEASTSMVLREFDRRGLSPYYQRWLPIERNAAGRLYLEIKRSIRKPETDF
jgi:hypothetical protein